MNESQHPSVWYARAFSPFSRKIAAGNQSVDQTGLALVPSLLLPAPPCIVLHTINVSSDKVGFIVHACVEGKNDEIFVCMCVSRKFVLKMHGLYHHALHTQ